MDELLDYMDKVDTKGLEAHVNDMYAFLQVQGISEMKPQNFMMMVATKLGFRWEETFNQTKMENYVDYNMKELVYLKNAMAKKGLFEEEAEASHSGIRDVCRKLRMVTNLLYTFNRWIAKFACTKWAFEELEHSTSIDPEGICRMVGEPILSMLGDDIKFNDYQELLLHSLNTASEKGYRKKGEHVHKRVVIPDEEGDIRTHAWQEVCSMEDFVRMSCDKELNLKMWRCMTSNQSVIAGATKYLVACKDSELPTLVSDRHVFAFSNGTYVTWVDKDANTVGDMFVPYKAPPNGKKLPSSTVAANYFTQPLDYMGDKHWSEMDTPNMDKILDTQSFTPDVKRWVYVFIGRMLYDLNEHDDWQVIPFLKGVGGTGKSTLINEVCGQFYPKHDIGILSNNIERKFGLSALVGKLMFLAPEVKEDLQLEQAEFQSIVVGEDVQIATKHETGRSIGWTIPGMLAGNEMPGWVDNSGSIARRVVIFFFGNAVPATQGDTELKRKLKAELPMSLQKCNRAYIEAVSEVGSNNIWLHLPKYFKQQQDNLRAETNSLEHFMVNGVCTYGEDEYIPREEFQHPDMLVGSTLLQG